MADDDLVLSSHALAALQEFIAEQQAAQKQLEEAKTLETRLRRL